jgi:mRNA interferase HigB
MNVGGRDKESSLMHIITKRRLKEFADGHVDAQTTLATWVKATESQQWHSIVDVHAVYPAADLVGNLTVFNIGGNKYRLVAFIDYTYGKVFIRAILTHAEYDEEKWKNDPWY